MAIDLTRVKRTRGGHEVRIYATDGGSVYQIHGAIRLSNGWDAKTWTRDGSFLGAYNLHAFDLIEEPRTVEVDVWLNIYQDGTFSDWQTREEADSAAVKARFACVYFTQTVTEGEGL